jgi:diphosphomevalonate decarboxylase
MKTTALAPANIAFLKYWGKTNDALRLPANTSFSMNLSGATTTTTVESSDSYEKDIVEFVDDVVSSHETKRIIDHIDILRSIARSTQRVRIKTKNSFPKGTGVASSASGFAALTVAAASSLGLSLSEKELTILSRKGSGSACRSIPDGFVLWEKGTSDETSYARSIAPSTYWELRDILCIVDTSMKKISTTDGHTTVATSPLWEKRIEQLPSVQEKMINAFMSKDFPKFGQLLEDECLNMHAVMQTQDPPLHYFTETTHSLIKTIQTWRTDGLPVYFTIDAGPNVHVICEKENEQRIVDMVSTLSGISRVMVNAPAKGTMIQDTHLF